jgi:hypothetical protein
MAQKNDFATWESGGVGLQETRFDGPFLAFAMMF